MPQHQGDDEGRGKPGNQGSKEANSNPDNMQVSQTKGAVGHKLIGQIPQPRKLPVEPPPFAVGLADYDKYGTGNDKVNPENDRDRQEKVEQTGPGENHHRCRQPNEGKCQKAVD